MTKRKPLSYTDKNAISLMKQAIRDIESGACMAESVQWEMRPHEADGPDGFVHHIPSGIRQVRVSLRDIAEEVTEG